MDVSTGSRRESGFRLAPARLTGSPGLRLVGILALGLVIRLLLGPHGVYSGDAQTFRGWAIRLVTTPLADFYAAPGRPIDHLPGDLWFLWGIAHLYRLIFPSGNFQNPGFLVLLKLVPDLADLATAAVLYLIARHLAGPRVGLLAAALFVLDPAPMFVSAIWGQWDAVSALAMVLALWLVVHGSPEWSLPLLTYASLVKPQLALLIPLVAVVWWRRNVQPPGYRPRWGPDLARALGRLGLAALSSLGLFLVVALPFDVGLPPLATRWTILQRLQVAWNTERSVSANAYNLWGILAHASGSRFIDDGRAFLLGVSYQHWGEALLALALAIALILVWRRPDAPTVLWAALAVTLSLFVLPTRIHERYLMPAVVLAVLLAALAPALRWVAAALSLTYLVNVVEVYRLTGQPAVGVGLNLGGRPSDLTVLAVAATNLFVLLVVFGAGVALARGPAAADAPVAAMRSD